MKLIECPRDAMQGMHGFIPTSKKIEYINDLLQVGFDTIDFGSFVSEKAVPQMKDTAEVLAGLNLQGSKSKLLCIVANLRGAQTAAEYEEIKYIGFPFSVSESFQLRNTNKTIDESYAVVKEIQDLALRNNKEMVVYLSMGFGNPYGDAWSPEIVADWCEKLHRETGVSIMALSDTVGVGTPENIHKLFSTLIPALSGVEFGAHLHTTPDTWKEKIEAALTGGCNRFDGAIKGYGGCPMAADSLTGNMPTENMVHLFSERGLIMDSFDQERFQKCVSKAATIFPEYI